MCIFAQQFFTMLQLSKNQIKFIKSLHQKKYRQEHQMFILEGEKLVNEALRDKPSIVEYIVVRKSSSFSSRFPVKVFVVDDSVFNTLSTLSTPQDIMAICHFLPEEECSIDLNNEFTFYLDRINDPGNLGTIIRICDWFGIRQIFCSPDTVELYNPKTINASKGSFLRVNVSYVEFEKIDSDKYPIYIADIEGEDVKAIKNKTGIVILGNEAQGISKEIKERIKNKINIPKHFSSKAESLNVAMSAAIIAYEFSR